MVSICADSSRSRVVQIHVVEHRDTSDVRCDTSDVHCDTSDVHCDTSDVHCDTCTVTRQTCTVTRQTCTVTRQTCTVGSVVSWDSWSSIYLWPYPGLMTSTYAKSDQT